MSAASSSASVLYLGDTSQQTAAAYLSAVLSFHQIDFDYVDSGTAFSDAFFERGYRVFILSDYAASQFTASQLERLCALIQDGAASLLMIGGWETYVGLGGDYHTSPLAALLPVTMHDSDDRVNSFAPCMIRADADHVIVKDLPFNTQSAAINGHNKFTVKDGAEQVLSLKRFSASWQDDDCVFVEESADPLLVLEERGAARIACYAGDVAPHWAGGFVDWGDQRHALQADGAGDVEIGNWYIQFFGNIVKWLLKEI